jgi:exo-beta-1,3-glucanase (GH17 family)
MPRCLALIVLAVSLITMTQCTSKTTAAQMSRFLNAFTPNATSPGCILFTSHVSGYRSGQTVPNSLITTLMRNLKTQTSYRCIELMSVDSTYVSLAHAQGFLVHGIVWLTTSTSQNKLAVQQAIAAAKAYPQTVVSLSCGSELAFRSGTGSTVTNIIKTCMTSIRNAGITVPVGTQDSLKTFNNGWSAMASEVDFFGVNIYPWYDNAGGSCLSYTQAAAQTYKRFVNVKARYPTKKFVSFNLNLNLNKCRLLPRPDGQDLAPQK